MLGSVSSGAGGRIWGIVVAAGGGVRFGRPKHELQLAGRPLWEWARDALLRSGAGRVVVVGPVPGGVEGGPERRISVARGLARVDQEAEIVAVHDAARPLAQPAMIAGMYETLRMEGLDGVIPVAPIPDAVKRRNAADGLILETLARTETEVVAAQTPQVFRAGALRRAHAAYAEGPPGQTPDDAAMVERIGGRVGTVPGDRAAMKITYPEDLALAEVFLGLRRAGTAGQP